MQQTTLKQYLTNFLQCVEQKHNATPIAIYFEEEFSKKLYKWSGETTLDYFLLTINDDGKRYNHCFDGVIWFNTGDYAKAYDRNEISSAWDYVVVPKLKDYFNVNN